MSIQGLIAELAKWATDEIAPRPLNVVLRYLIDQVVEQGESISRLEKMLGQHITNPFRAGAIYLEEANSAFDEQSQRDNLKKAIDSFIAVAQLDTTDFPLVAVKSQFYIGVCYDLLGERGVAIRWYERSYKSALDEADKTSAVLKKPAGLIKSATKEKLARDTLRNLEDFSRQITSLRLIGNIRRLPCEVVEGIEFSPDGRSLICSSVKGKLTLWDVNNNKLLFQVQFKNASGKVSALGQVAFSPDGRLIAVAVLDQGIFICDARDGKPIRKFGEGEEVRGLAFSPDGKFVASGSNKGVIIWDSSIGKAVNHLNAHPHPADAVIFSHDGSLLASGANNGVKLWKFGSNEIIANFSLSSSEKIRVFSLSFSPDDTLLAVGGWKGSLRIWNLKEHRFSNSYETGSTALIRNVVFSPDGSLLAAETHVKTGATSNDAIRFWDVRRAKVFYDFILDQPSSINLFCISPSGLKLAIGPGFIGDLLLCEFRYKSFAKRIQS